MSRQYWSECISWATADGTAVANTTTETILMPNLTLPANYMQDGRLLRVRVQGKLSTTGTPTMTFKLRWGGVGGTVICQSAALTQGSGVTNIIFDLEFFIQVRANGSAGTVVAIGVANVGSMTTVTNLMCSAGASVPAAVTVDLTADTALAITGTWSAASASNTITGMQFAIESLN